MARVERIDHAYVLRDEKTGLSVSEAFETQEEAEDHLRDIELRNQLKAEFLDMVSEWALRRAGDLEVSARHIMTLLDDFHPLQDYCWNDEALK